MLRYVGQNKIFSQEAVKALRTIKYCAITIIGFAVVGEAYLFIIQRGVSDDIAGGVFMGVLIVFGSSVIVTMASVFERIL